MSKKEVVKTNKTLPEFEPAADIIQGEESIKLWLDLPGVDEANVSVNVENNILSIQGRVERTQDEALSLIYEEFGDREYRRSFRLSDKIDRGAVKADLKNGLLIIDLPYMADLSPRKISVNVA